MKSLANAFLLPIRIARRYLRYVLSFLLLILFVDTLSILHSSPPVPSIPAHSTPHETLYIAGLHWNSAPLIREHWGPAVLDLVHHYGVANVYISIVEGGSWDDTKAALDAFEAELDALGVERHIELETSTHADAVSRVPAADEEGWVNTGSARELRRIPYLAKLRNKAMEPLRDMKERRVFTRVLWLNDVVFSTSDVVELLATKGGDYAAVCSMDFSHPPLYYDTFALRDDNGLPTLSLTWPYFSSVRARAALDSEEAILVQSCWNGVVVFDAKPFYDGLAFRGLPDGLAQMHLEASECCLVHVDNALSSSKGVYVNPRVRVGYSGAAYEAVRFENLRWPSTWWRLVGIWKLRLLGWTGWVGRFLARRKVERQMESWFTSAGPGETRKEAGAVCIVDEMQVLLANGWKHV